MNKKQLLRWLVIVVCLYLIATTVGSIWDLWRSGDKLTRRETQLNELNKQTQELQAEKKMVESPDYREKMAREQLGLSKPGEQIIIIPKELLAQGPQPMSDNTPNWKKWLKLFF